MSRSIALIVTSKDDAHADAVIAAANAARLGHAVLRLNTEDFLGNCTVRITDTECAITLADSGCTLDARDVSCVWYRRPIDVDVSHVDPEAQDFARQQATAVLRGLYFLTHDSARWINPLPALHRARIKLQQLRAARDVGFRVPATLVSNSDTEILDFAETLPAACVKSLDEPSFTCGGRLHSIYTRQVGIAELRENRQSLRVCPVLVQELVPKRFDIRVVVMGQQVFAFEIHSQEHPLSTIDFRGLAPHLLRHATHELPDSIRSRVLAFVRQQGLVFSSMDLVQMPDGQYVFIENNPNGQWLWLEQRTGARLTDYMLSWLLDLVSVSAADA